MEDLLEEGESQSSAAKTSVLHEAPLQGHQDADQGTTSKCDLSTIEKPGDKNEADRSVLQTESDLCKIVPESTQDSSLITPGGCSEGRGGGKAPGCPTEGGVVREGGGRAQGKAGCAESNDYEVEGKQTGPAGSQDEKIDVAKRSSKKLDVGKENESGPGSESDIRERKREVTDSHSSTHVSDNDVYKNNGNTSAVSAISDNKESMHVRCEETEQILRSEEDLVLSLPSDEEDSESECEMQTSHEELSQEMKQQGENTEKDKAMAEEQESLPRGEIDHGHHALGGRKDTQDSGSGSSEASKAASGSNVQEENMSIDKGKGCEGKEDIKEKVNSEKTKQIDAYKKQRVANPDEVTTGSERGVKEGKTNNSEVEEEEEYTEVNEGPVNTFEKNKVKDDVKRSVKKNHVDVVKKGSVEGRNNAMNNADSKGRKKEDKQDRDILELKSSKNVKDSQNINNSDPDDKNENSRKQRNSDLRNSGSEETSPKIRKSGLDDRKNNEESEKLSKGDTEEDKNEESKTNATSDFEGSESTDESYKTCSSEMDDDNKTEGNIGGNKEDKTEGNIKGNKEGNIANKEDKTEGNIANKEDKTEGNIEGNKEGNIANKEDKTEGNIEGNKDAQNSNKGKGTEQECAVKTKNKGESTEQKCDAKTNKANSRNFVEELEDSTEATRDQAGVEKLGTKDLTQMYLNRGLGDEEEKAYDSDNSMLSEGLGQSLRLTSDSEEETDVELDEKRDENEKESESEVRKEHEDMETEGSREEEEEQGDIRGSSQEESNESLPDITKESVSRVCEDEQKIKKGEIGKDVLEMNAGKDEQKIKAGEIGKDVLENNAAKDEHGKTKAGKSGKDVLEMNAGKDKKRTLRSVNQHHGPSDDGESAVENVNKGMDQGSVGNHGEPKHTHTNQPHVREEETEETQIPTSRDRFKLQQKEAEKSVSEVIKPGALEKQTSKESPMEEETDQSKGLNVAKDVRNQTEEHKAKADKVSEKAPKADKEVSEKAPKADKEVSEKAPKSQTKADKVSEKAPKADKEVSEKAPKSQIKADKVSEKAPKANKVSEKAPKSQTKADKVGEKAPKSQTKADKVGEKAPKSQTKADKVSEQAPKSQTKADKVSEQAPKSQTKADKVGEKAPKSQTKADKVGEKAPKSQTKADKVGEKASKSQTKADNVSEKAPKSQTKADKVGEKAPKSQTKADKVSEKAPKSQTKADKVSEKAPKSQPPIPEVSQHQTEHSESATQEKENKSTKRKRMEAKVDEGKVQRRRTRSQSEHLGNAEGIPLECDKTKDTMDKTKDTMDKTKDTMDKTKDTMDKTKDTMDKTNSEVTEGAGERSTETENAGKVIHKDTHDATQTCKDSRSNTHNRNTVSGREKTSAGQKNIESGKETSTGQKNIESGKETSGGQRNIAKKSTSKLRPRPRRLSTVHTEPDHQDEIIPQPSTSREQDTEDSDEDSDVDSDDSDIVILAENIQTPPVLPRSFLVCLMCQTLWNDSVLEAIFEGNKCVTVNSKITYGAVMCFTRYADVHYVQHRDQAVRSVLERADLGKNIGSMKMTEVVEWLTYLMLNGSATCCKVFDAMYNPRTTDFVFSSMVSQGPKATQELKQFKKKKTGKKKPKKSKKNRSGCSLPCKAGSKATASANSTQSSTSSANTTQPSTASANTTQPSTASANTTQPSTASANTTQPSTASANTTQSSTASANTTQPFTASANTTQPTTTSRSSSSSNTTTTTRTSRSSSSSTSSSTSSSSSSNSSSTSRTTKNSTKDKITSTNIKDIPAGLFQLQLDSSVVHRECKVTPKKPRAQTTVETPQSPLRDDSLSLKKNVTQEKFVMKECTVYLGKPVQIPSSPHDVDSPSVSSSPVPRVTKRLLSEESDKGQQPRKKIKAYRQSSSSGESSSTKDSLDSGTTDTVDVPMKENSTAETSTSSASTSAGSSKESGKANMGNIVSDLNENIEDTSQDEKTLMEQSSDKASTGASVHSDDTKRKTRPEQSTATPKEDSGEKDPGKGEKHKKQKMKSQGKAMASQGNKNAKPSTRKEKPGETKTENAEDKTLTQKPEVPTDEAEGNKIMSQDHCEKVESHDIKPIKPSSPNDNKPIKPSSPKKNTGEVNKEDADDRAEDTVDSDLSGKVQVRDKKSMKPLSKCKRFDIKGLQDQIITKRRDVQMDVSDGSSSSKSSNQAKRSAVDSAGRSSKKQKVLDESTGDSIEDQKAQEIKENLTGVWRGESSKLDGNARRKSSRLCSENLESSVSSFGYVASTYSDDVAPSLEYSDKSDDNTIEKRPERKAKGKVEKTSRATKTRPQRAASTKKVVSYSGETSDSNDQQDMGTDDSLPQSRSCTDYSPVPYIENTEESDVLIQKLGLNVDSIELYCNVSDKKMLINRDMIKKQDRGRPSHALRAMIKERSNLDGVAKEAFDLLPFEPNNVTGTTVNKERYLTNQELLVLQSICVLTPEAPDVDMFYQILIQLLLARRRVLLVPNSLALLLVAERVRKEFNRSKRKGNHYEYLAQDWDACKLYTTEDFWLADKKPPKVPTVRTVLSMFCLWKNLEKRVPISLPIALEELCRNLVLWDVDKIGICVKLYSRYCTFLYEDKNPALTEFFLNQPFNGSKTLLQKNILLKCMAGESTVALGTISSRQSMNVTDNDVQMLLKLCLEAEQAVLLSPGPKGEENFRKCVHALKHKVDSYKKEIHLIQKVTKETEKNKFQLLSKFSNPHFEELTRDLNKTTEVLYRLLGKRTTKFERMKEAECLAAKDTNKVCRLSATVLKAADLGENISHSMKELVYELLLNHVKVEEVRPACCAIVESLTNKSLSIVPSDSWIRNFARITGLKVKSRNSSACS